MIKDMSKVLSIVLVLCFFCSTLFSQLPKTEIYSFQFRIISDSMVLTNGKRLTSFNPNGYNNQPQFFGDDIVYLSSNYFDPSQTDIIKLDLRNQRLTRVTATPEGEYSPTIMKNGREFSVIKDTQGLGDIYQLLWSYPVNQLTPGRRVIPNITTVGYHNWLSSSKIALFLVESPIQMAIYDIFEESLVSLGTDIGRCMVTLGNQLFYTRINANGDHVLNAIDYISDKNETFQTLPKGTQDFAITDNGRIICGQGSALFMSSPNPTAEWVKIKELDKNNINKISRMTIRKNKILIVNAK